MNVDKEYACLLRCVREAGDRALHIQSTAKSEIKADGTPVSEADTLANDIIVTALQASFPEDSILSEEITDDLSRLHARRVWIIDPIDGTSAFLEGRDEWAVQVALAIDNQLTIAALYLPAKNRFYLGTVGHQVDLYDNNGNKQLCHIAEDPQNCILLSRSKRNQQAMIKIEQELQEYSFLTISSIGAKVDALIQGLGCFHLNPAEIYEWDYAAPAAILLAAGGSCSDRLNNKLPINSKDKICQGLVFSYNAYHEKILTRLTDV
ncbi:MAG: hypothetical protein HRU15_01420 [Planctomycetes bacterium]|nr:hypothetical protein [Planctomycetota bacterium]